MLEKPVEKCAQLQLEPSRQGFSTGGQSHVRWFKKKKKKKKEKKIAIGRPYSLPGAQEWWVRDRPRGEACL